MENIWITGVTLTFIIGFFPIAAFSIIQFFYWVWHWIYDKKCGCFMDKIWPSLGKYVKKGQETWGTKIHKCGVILLFASALWFFAWPALFIITCLFSLRSFVRFKTKINEAITVFSKKKSEDKP